MEYKRIFTEYILGTSFKAPIIWKRIFICSIKMEVRKVICWDAETIRSIFISTWALKHIYDRHFYDKNATDDFYLIFNNLLLIVTEPDYLYKNIPGKRGDFLFIKRIGTKLCLCSIEIFKDQEAAAIVSGSVTGEKYLKKFTLLWSREDG